VAALATGCNVAILPPREGVRPHAVDDAERALELGLREDVRVLAEVVGERNLRHPDALAAAADFIDVSFVHAGYEVHRQRFEATGFASDNLEAEVRGATLPNEIVVVGAHYDTVSGSAGADDNASGTAALLALARAFGQRQVRRTLRFVAFTNEEPPYFQTDQMGSLVYARACRAKREPIVGMLSLESLGYFSDEPGSQSYPFPFGLIFPPVGDFVAFIADPASDELLTRAVGTFRHASTVRSQGAALPAIVPGVGWSDHWAFWKAGYPAVMVTDTAPFRNPNYHRQSDVRATLAYDRLASVVTGLEAVVADLADGR
jgi:Zn-dependent M28 family amino/carboxypeptidase